MSLADDMKQIEDRTAALPSSDCDAASDPRFVTAARHDAPALVEMVKLLLGRLGEVDSANGWGLGFMPNSLEERLWAEAKRRAATPPLASPRTGKPSNAER